MADEYPTYELHEAHGSHSSTWKRISVDRHSTMEVLICDTCHLIRAECNHDLMIWDADGTTLTCAFCGIDGT